MKTKVILSQYCTFATIGFSEMKLGNQRLAILRPIRGELDRNIRKEPPAHRKWQWDDQEHEQGHLCY